VRRRDARNADKRGKHFLEHHRGRDSINVHNDCLYTEGGIKLQNIATEKGSAYRLLFDARVNQAVSEGQEYPRLVYVCINSEKVEKCTRKRVHAVGSNNYNWQRVEQKFTATGKTNVKIFARKGHCINVADITLAECVAEFEDDSSLTQLNQSEPYSEPHADDSD
jgi:hypothetical protein